MIQLAPACKMLCIVLHENAATSRSILKEMKHLELFEAGLQVQLHGFGIAQVRPVTLITVPEHKQDA